MSRHDRLTLDEVLRAMDKVLGPGKVVRASNFVADIPRIPTGILALDLATGGGFPKGRISILAGKESSCKSAVAYETIANAQARGETAALIDVEQGLTESWGRALGIDMDKLLIAYPETAEDAFNVADALTNNNGIDLLVLDSLAALSPDEEREKSFGEGEKRAERAKLVNRLMRCLTANLQPTYDRDSGMLVPSGTTVILIQQLRRDPSSAYFVEYMPGGLGQRFHSSLTIYMKRIRWLVETIVSEYEDRNGKLQTVEDERTVGLEVKWAVEKSKVSPAQRQGTFSFFTENTLDGTYHQGQVLETAELIHIGQVWGLIKRSGSWYTLLIDDNEYKAQGEGQMTDLFAEHGHEFVDALLTRMKQASEEMARAPRPERPTLAGGESNGASLDAEDERGPDEGAETGEEDS